MNEGAAGTGLDEGFPRPKLKVDFGEDAADCSALSADAGGANENVGFATSEAVLGLANEKLGILVVEADCDVDGLDLLLSGDGTTMAFSGEEARGRWSALTFRKFGA